MYRKVSHFWDNSTVAVGGAFDDVRFYDKEKLVLKIKHGIDINNMVSDSGDLLFCCSESGDIIMICVKRKSVISRIVGASDGIWGIEHIQSEQRIVTSSNDKEVRVWEYNDDHINKSPISVMKDHGDSIGEVRWIKEIGKVCSACDDGLLRIWDVEKPDKPLVTMSGHEGAINAMDYNGRELIVSGAKDGLRVWSTSDLYSRQGHFNNGDVGCVLHIPKTEDTWSLLVSNNRMFDVIVGGGYGSENKMHHYDLRKPKSPCHVWDGHESAVFRVIQLGHLDLFATCSNAEEQKDYNLKIWNFEDCKLEYEVAEYDFVFGLEYFMGRSEKLSYDMSDYAEKIDFLKDSGCCSESEIEMFRVNIRLGKDEYCHSIDVIKILFLS